MLIYNSSQTSSNVVFDQVSLHPQVYNDDILERTPESRPIQGGRKQDY